MKPNSAQWLEATVSAEGGHPLTGNRKYRLDFDAGALPPVYDLWSVSVYDARTFGNSLERYSQGDWSEGLKYRDDGSLSLYLQHSPPASGLSNWIPTPSRDFVVVLRLYEPSEVVLDGSYVLPPIEISVSEPDPAPRRTTTRSSPTYRASAHFDPGSELAVIGFELLPKSR